MQCTECRALIHAYVDGELDHQTTARAREHFASCAACRGDSERVATLRAAIKGNAVRHDVPERLTRRVREAIRAEPAHRDRRRNQVWSWLNAGASFACAATLLFSVALYRAVPSDLQRLTDEIAASHSRALLVDHLADVASSDQHTVKPWFTSKLDYSPPVVDLAPQGFALAGGRLDYIGERVVAALAYRRRDHVINLYVWPDAGAINLPSETASTRGFQQLRWAHAGMRYWAVSDLNALELDEFRQRLTVSLNAGNS